MRQKSVTRNEPAEKVVRDIRRATRKQYFAEEKIRIVLSGLRGDLPHTFSWALAFRGRRVLCQAEHGAKTLVIQELPAH